MTNDQPAETVTDVLARLEAMRDQITADLDVCQSFRDRAALYLRLTSVLVKLEEFQPRPTPPPKELDAIDRIAARRRARRAGLA